MHSMQCQVSGEWCLNRSLDIMQRSVMIEAVNIGERCLPVVHPVDGRNGLGKLC